MVLTDFFHSLFRIPYKLHIASDSKEGAPIIFLHGIASDSSTWKHVIPLLPASFRAITIDLLGFGESPKPKRNDYATQDHIHAIAKTVATLQLSEPAIIVGHSMGGLLAIELAKQYPKLVSRLILISTPLYKPEDIITATSKYATTKKSLSNGLFNVYEKVIENEKTTLKTAQTLMKLVPGSGFSLNKDTWVPFKKSLTNTIMRQTCLADILALPMPVHLYYGKLDMLMQHKNYAELIVLNKPNITITSVTSGHMITKSTAKTIVADMQTKI